MWIAMVGFDWCVSILVVSLWSCFPRGPIWSCSLGGSLMYRSPVVFLDRWFPRFRNFNSVVPIDVIRVKSYVDSFPDPTGVPVWVSINKLYLVPKRVVAGLFGVVRNGWGLGTGESYIPVMLFDPPLHRSTCFTNVDFSAFTGNPVDHAVLFSGSTVSFGRTKSDLSVVSDLKTARIPCCCRQRRRGSDSPLIYGKTAVDLELKLSKTA